MLSAQIWGMLFVRKADMWEYPGRRSACDNCPVDNSLQYDTGDSIEPTRPFPRHGYVMKGRYYDMINCSSNLVNVRPLVCVSDVSMSLCSVLTLLIRLSCTLCLYLQCRQPDVKQLLLRKVVSPFECPPFCSSSL